jgi:hypothetical protein
MRSAESASPPKSKLAGAFLNVLLRLCSCPIEGFAEPGAAAPHGPRFARWTAEAAVRGCPYMVAIPFVLS